jgi:4-hydroxy-3-methylbut-2-enyl diphosphate reductase
MLNKLGCKIFDATCPEVMKSAGQICRLRRKGDFVILFGAESHPETICLAGYGGEDLCVCSTENELHNLQILPGRALTVLAQTTAVKELFYEFVKIVKVHFPHATAINSICNSTQNRQNELLQMLHDGHYDCVVVIGDLRSANSCNLAKLASSSGVRTLHAPVASWLHDIQFSQNERILITAGATTPDEDITKVEMFLRTIP